MFPENECSPSGLSLRRFNEEVLFSDSPLTTLTCSDIEWLQVIAARNPRKRIRICAHMHSNSKLHEMFIIHTRETYVRVHKHLDKCESFHVISGEVDVVLFEDDGKISRVIQMGEYGSGKRFYYRLEEARYHTLLIRSDVLAFHEVTTGPFAREDTRFAEWSPEESQREHRLEFIAKLERQILLSLSAEKSN